MKLRTLEEILHLVASGQISTKLAIDKLRGLPYQDLGFAKVDRLRQLNQGMPEVIFCPGKTNEQIIEIAQELKADYNLVLATRAAPKQAEAILPFLDGATYHSQARVIVWGEIVQLDNGGKEIGIVTAGTADIGVAEEAALVLEAQGILVERIYDVGVAGLHRLLANLDKLRDLSATIVVAGMDGALPSVIAGLVPTPVIAVPTSIGYGANFQGLAALLSMLNTCAQGLTVVNIDNGFGAAAAAVRLLNVHKRNQQSKVIPVLRETSPCL